MKPLLPKCISSEQSAFVEDRSILDNVLVAIETLHHLKCKTSGKVGELALKIDISKAYDRVDWTYLKEIMKKMGFDARWISWMTMCLETVSYSILVNGEKVGPIAPGRGLRQGDPLSPYLFIICAEGLTSLLKRAESRGDLHGVSVCRGAPSLTHLLFADDCFLFCRATETESRHLQDILQIYEAASGQAINMSKSEIFFSRNTTQEVRAQVTGVLGVTECIGTGKYLGLPSMIGRNKKQMFGYLRDRMWKRVQQWSGKHLSKAGREVLVKSVAQSIPTYCMSTFMLPTTLGEELEKMINSFWWGSNQGARRGLHWLNWEKLTMRKEHGGMGFRHFHGFNLALLGKQAWKLMTRADTIVGRVFKAKYYPDCDFMGARLGHNPSYIWRSIYSSRVVINIGSRWKLGDGQKVPVWGAPWLKGRKDTFVRSPMVAGSENMRVGELWKENRNEWNEDLVDALFTNHEAAIIKKMPLYNFNEEDRIVWWRSRNGEYSVRSAYYGIMEDLIDNSHLRVPGNWMRIWRLKIPQRMKIFLWRVARGCLPTRGNLRRRHVPCEEVCPMCESGEENEFHLFINCNHALQVWQELNFTGVVQPFTQQHTNFRDCLFDALEALSAEDQQVLVLGLWVMWKRRNDKVWEGSTKDVHIAVQLAWDNFTAWESARTQPRSSNSNSTAAHTSHQHSNNIIFSNSSTPTQQQHQYQYSNSSSSSAATTATAQQQHSNSSSSSAATTATVQQQHSNSSAATEATAQQQQRSSSSNNSASTTAAQQQQQYQRNNNSNMAWTAAHQIHSGSNNQTTTHQQQRHSASSSGIRTTTSNHQQVLWSRPDPGFLKCNIDAAIFEDDCKYGIGMCIRDENGSFMEGKTMWFEGVPEPQEAEAMGLWHTLNWLKDLGLESIAIEMDCISVVKAVTKAPSNNTDFGTIISHCISLLSNLPSYRISFIRRQANLVAHLLARASRDYASSTNHYIAPLCITTILDNEMN